MKNEVLVTLVGDEMELISVEEYLEVTSEEVEDVEGECYPSCVGCKMKQYCEVMGSCLA